MGAVRNAENGALRKSLRRAQSALSAMSSERARERSEFLAQRVTVQNIKYELQCRWAKYSEAVSVLRSGDVSTVKQSVARLATENDALEEELVQMAECWRGTSRLMQRHIEGVEAQLEEVRRRNGVLEAKLKENGLSVDAEDKEREREVDEDGEDGEMAALWDEDEDAMSSSSHFV